MHSILANAFVAATFMSVLGISHALPVTLDDELLDQLSAGGQYSYVEGGAFAAVGTVQVKTKTNAIERPNGTSVTRATLIVKAVGTGLDAYGYGESGADGLVSAVYGEGHADQGKIIIRVKTISKVEANGDIMTKSKVQVKTVESANVRTSVATSLVANFEPAPGYSNQTRGHSHLLKHPIIHGHGSRLNIRSL